MMSRAIAFERRSAVAMSAMSRVASVEWPSELNNMYSASYGNVVKSWFRGAVGQQRQ